MATRASRTGANPRAVGTPSRAFRAPGRAWPLLLVALLLACCPVPAGATRETAFAARIDSVTLPTAVATLDDGRVVRLAFDHESASAAVVEGSRVYVEGVFSGEFVKVRRILLL